MKQIRMVLLLLGVSAIALGIFQNCSNVSFESKDEFVAQATVFPSPAPTPTPNPAPVPTPLPPPGPLPPPPPPPIPTFTYPASFMCLRATSGLAPAPYSIINVALATTSGTLICSDSTNVYPSLQSSRVFTWTPPAACVATPGQYLLILYDPNRGVSLHPYWNQFPGLMPPYGLSTDTVNVDANKNITYVSANWAALNVDGVFRGPPPNAINVSSLSPLCDHTTTSPLIMKMTTKKDGGIPLSSQKDGILFDVLGLNSYPTPHSKKRISWMSTGDYRYIVKPNERGEVNGIDEMFGNNTHGPDGKFAPNGYKALAKFDVNHDNFITKDDLVFKDLRLWADLNGDGKAQPTELMTLDEAEVVSIDLTYDNRYFEQDQYGNQTLMKSVAIRKDNSFRLIFDLWFRYLEN